MRGCSLPCRQTYSLPPDKLQRAIEYAHAGYWLHFASEIYAIVILAAIVASGLSAKFRDWAEAASKRRFVQALVFIPLLLVTNDLLYLPANLYGQHLELKFDQSIQSWPSWFWDWTKSELILLVCAVPLAWLLYAVIRRSPRRWWLYFWLATLPIIVTVMYLEPMVIEPLFYRFEPLAATHPALVNQLEKLVARGGLAIPPDRMFEMKASEKLNSLNAYVSGFGGSKRVVVWDTTLQKLTTPETSSSSATKWGTTFSATFAIPCSGFRCCCWSCCFSARTSFAGCIARWGTKWRIRDTADWASLPVLLLIVAIFQLPHRTGYKQLQPLAGAPGGHLRPRSNTWYRARFINRRRPFVSGNGRDRPGRAQSQPFHRILALLSSFNVGSTNLRAKPTIHGRTGSPRYVK